MDGVDPDNCANVTIEDSTIRAGDDCIAIYSTQVQYSRTDKTDVCCIHACPRSLGAFVHAQAHTMALKSQHATPKAAEVSFPVEL